MLNGVQLISVLSENVLFYAHERTRESFIGELLYMSLQQMPYETTRRVFGGMDLKTCDPEGIMVSNDDI